MCGHASPQEFPAFKHKMETFRYLSIAGAGTRGAAYLGMIDAIEDNLGQEAYRQWRNGLLGVVGCSSGGIAALTLILGLSREKRRQLLMDFDMRHLVRQPDINMLITQYGIESGSALREFIQSILIAGGLSPHSTFRDIDRLLRVRFVCVASDIDNSCISYLSNEHTPDVLIADALCASCCIPLLFRPIVINGKNLVDGCLMCALPDLFDTGETLFACIRDDDEPSLTNWMTYMFSLLKCAIASQNTHINLLKNYPNNVMMLHGGATSPFDLEMTGSVQGANMAHSGYVSCLNYLSGGRLHRTMYKACTTYLNICYMRNIPTEEYECPP